LSQLSTFYNVYRLENGPNRNVSEFIKNAEL